MIFSKNLIQENSMIWKCFLKLFLKKPKISTSIDKWNFKKIISEENINKNVRLTS